MTKEEIKKLVSEMTLEEKCGLTSGIDFWRTKPVERLGIPQVMVSDGPNGLRKQDDEADNLGINDAIKAVCFPTGCATAASFNRDIIREIGEAIGEECQAEGVSTILGPGACIKRSPLCGRNFEYFSEDPYAAGECATAFINGVQSKNVGTSLKHFLANSQEHRRFSSNSVVDERALREIYLPAFEAAVKNAKPWTVMCSYNKINGFYAAENKKFLTDILRDEWGYEGIVVSDWGAVNNRPKDVEAGLDLEMPASHGNDDILARAIKNGEISEEALDKACERILAWIYKYEENKKERYVWDRMADHKVACKAAEETIVLLKNEGVLPLAKGKKIAFIGQYAEAPRYQGGGSSHINSMYISSAVGYVKDESIPGVEYARGFDDKLEEIDEKMFNEAVELAKNSEIAVVFAGLPDAYESEGFDRRHLHMPEAQNKLIEAVAAVNKNTVVVLHNGAPVEMPWIDKVPAVLEAYLSGEGVGPATVKILYGDVNPSAKLAETFPLKLAHNPSYLNYFGEGDETIYKESIYVGYRYYDKKEMDVLFPFGHGLSYTSFEYSDLSLDKSEMLDTDTLKVSVKVKNTGAVTGKEVVQLYVGAKDGEFVLRPVKELRAYDKIELAPGEEKTVSFELSKRAFAYYETKINDWYVETDDYDILVGSSSRDIRLSAKIRVNSTVRKPIVFTTDSTGGDVMRVPECKDKVVEFFGKYMSLFDVGDDAAQEAIMEEMVRQQINYSPLRTVVSFSLKEKITMEEVQKFVDEMNEIVRNL